MWAWGLLRLFASHPNLVTVAAAETAIGHALCILTQHLALYLSLLVQWLLHIHCTTYSAACLHLIFFSLLQTCLQDALISLQPADIVATTLQTLAVVSDHLCWLAEAFKSFLLLSCFWQCHPHHY